MKIIKRLPLLLLLGIGACSTMTKTYFTADNRHQVEQKGIPLSKLQFYIDKDVELKRELASRDAKVTSGKIKLENGKYVNIILLKAGTAGVCTQTNRNSLDISFENGDSKNLYFGVPERSGSNAVYSMQADQWLHTFNNPEIGKITYDGDVYFMRFKGDRPKLLVMKSAKDKYEINKRVMSGRKIS